jgi:antibiotic biosynthesis monooxygenase (ABM) superfamily enzyme
MSHIDEILTERGKKPGNWKAHSEISQAIKELLRHTPGWKQLNYYQKEAIEMITYQIALLHNGHADNPEYWETISTIATLTANGIKETKNV